MILFSKGGYTTSTIGFMFNYVDDDNYEYVLIKLVYREYTLYNMCRIYIIQ